MLYPDPPLVTVIPEIVPFCVTLAVAVAPLPVAETKVTTGGRYGSYPLPLDVNVTDETTPPAVILAVAVAVVPLESGLTRSRLVASDSKATKRPSPLIEGLKLPLFPCSPSPFTLSRFVRKTLPYERTKMSLAALISF